MKEPYSEREIREIAESVKSLSSEFKVYTVQVNEYIKQDAVAHATMIEAMKSIREDTEENTNFRKKVVTAVVGTAFMALSALGVGLLKVTGVLNLTR